MSTVIKGGTVVAADRTFKADVLIDNGSIAAVGDNLSGSETIDASGCYLMPGGIDPHTHMEMPFMGTFSKDDYESASKAALVGGTTSLIEMCCPSRADDPLESYELWKSKAEGKAACDYSFHMAVSRFDDDSEAQLRQIVESGIASFKIFLMSKKIYPF